MNKETDKLSYLDALGDFGSIIIEHGARTVVKDFVQLFPQQAYEFTTAMLNREKQIPALFKKDV